MKSISNSKKLPVHVIVLCGLVFGLGVGSGWLLWGASKAPLINVVREQSADYKFISPSLFVTFPESVRPEFLTIKQALNNEVQKTLADKKATKISVYYRDLNTSNWVGIDPTEKYSAASMLKVVVLMAVLRAAESDPGLLSSHIAIAPSATQVSERQDYYPSKNPVKVGQTYSVQELLSRLVIDSDNNASSVLYQLVGTDQVKKTFTDLQVPMPDSDTGDFDTSQEYSHLFRALYNATYLNRGLSEQVLDLLSRTTFNDGLVAGLPPGTVVSHKFGERTFTPLNSDTASATHQLHDCGIVYYPEHPYFLCIMTEGADFPTLAREIASISKTTWEKVAALYPH